MRALLPAAAGEVDLDAAYAVPASRWVRANVVSSADGGAEIGGRSGPLGGPADRRVFGLLRQLADVVLVGAGTVRAEGYGPVRMPPARRAARQAAGLAPVPPVAVVSARLDLDPSSVLFTEAEARPIVLTGGGSPADRRARLGELADVIVRGDGAVDAAAALEALAARGLGRVLCEGGPSLLGTLARDGLLDEMCVTLAPLLAGPDHLRVVEGARWPTPRRLRLAHVLEEDGALFLRYQAAEGT
ncbi:MAG TPA: pyrimidine reductase family protein [Frankiaceae bacterium]|nr:pyrimidine reductase family protein [Frankiaceae bacterium]